MRCCGAPAGHALAAERWPSSGGGAGGRALVPPPVALAAAGQVRTAIRHPIKAVGHVLGHKLEVVYGQHTKRRNIPPKIPKHPLQDLDQNMNEVLTYADLKLRWQWTTKFNNSHMKVARKWKKGSCWLPAPEPTCAFIWHHQMPHRVPMPPKPAESAIPRVDTSDAFAVFKSSIRHQHKVTIGDLVQCEKLHRRDAGDKITFGTVLLVGSKDFTIIGKPTVPYAKVRATIEQQTLSRECLTYKYKAKRKQQRFLRRRQVVTMIRIDAIELDVEGDPTDPPPPKPERLLDLWANRWLDPVEKEGIERVMGPNGEMVPAVAELYDGSEHQPASYHRRGLAAAYRFWPDPQSSHWAHIQNRTK